MADREVTKFYEQYYLNQKIVASSIRLGIVAFSDLADLQKSVVQSALHAKYLEHTKANREDDARALVAQLTQTQRADFLLRDCGIYLLVLGQLEREVGL